jgi:glycine cleavage system H protein
MAKVRNYEMPDDLYYHKDFCWVRKESDDLVRVGLIDFAQAEAGDITYIDLPFEGDEVTANETCGKIQSAKWIGKMVSPVSGEIVEVNYELDSDATLDEDMSELFSGQAALTWLEKEIAEVEKGKAEGKNYAAD